MSTLTSLHRAGKLFLAALVAFIVLQVFALTGCKDRKPPEVCDPVVRPAPLPPVKPPVADTTHPPASKEQPAPKQGTSSSKKQPLPDPFAGGRRPVVCDPIPPPENQQEKPARKEKSVKKADPPKDRQVVYDPVPYPVERPPVAPTPEQDPTPVTPTPEERK